MPTRRELIGAAGASVALAATPALSQEGASSAAGGSPERLKIIGLEEHVVLPEIQAAWARTPGVRQGFETGFGDEPHARRLRDFGERTVRG